MIAGGMMSYRYTAHVLTCASFSSGYCFHHCVFVRLLVSRVTLKSYWLIFDDMVAVWLSSSALVLINKATIRRVRLVLGWVTVCGQVNRLSL